MRCQLEIHSELQMKQIAKLMSQELNCGDLILLEGLVGTGKSTFARAFIKHYFNDEMMDVPSPTFTLVQVYEKENCAIQHADLYRLGDLSELEELGLFEDSSDKITLIEWADRLEHYKPSRYISINIEDLGTAEMRRLTLNFMGSGWERLQLKLNSLKLV